MFAQKMYYYYSTIPTYLMVYQSGELVMPAAYLTYEYYKIIFIAQ